LAIKYAKPLWCDKSKHVISEAYNELFLAIYQGGVYDIYQFIEDNRKSFNFHRYMDTFTAGRSVFREKTLSTRSHVIQ